MKYIHAHGKQFIGKELEGLVIGGQNNADSICFVVPKLPEEGLDLSSWSWMISYRNRLGTGDIVTISDSSVSQSNPDNMHIIWTPSKTATMVSGRLQVQLYAVLPGASASEDRIYSFAPFSIYVEEWLQPFGEMPKNPTAIEQALHDTLQYRNEAESFATSAGQSAGTASSAKKDAESARDQITGPNGLLAQTKKAAKDADNSKIAAQNAETEIVKKGGLLDQAKAEAKKAVDANGSAQSALGEIKNPGGLLEQTRKAKTDAEGAASRASTSEDNAAGSASSASASATAAGQSEKNASTSATAASGSATRASTSEGNAKASETAASTSEKNAAASEAKALASKNAAAGSEGNAALSATAADNAKKAAEQAVEEAKGLTASSRYLPIVEEGILEGIEIQIRQGHVYLATHEITPEPAQPASEV